MGVTRKVLNWCDEKMNEAMDLNEPKPYEKAMASGFVEGLIDGAIIMYVPVLVACYYWKSKALKK